MFFPFHSLSRRTDSISPPPFLASLFLFPLLLHPLSLCRNVKAITVPQWLPQAGPWKGQSRRIKGNMTSNYPTALIYSNCFTCVLSFHGVLFLS
ncbi:hypothetical protein JHK82_044519 [Glycine max]|uniref:Secreted protein n=1 Tax=Glycine max TaxID=3847 RepID=K7MG52_SOYBN|nr:hypothetical protein JHK87_044712 [Glycine soja]KAG5099467.1 hypothetical protein JHK82_044519 [Glycine max]KRH07480.1 hypothetical protein GLYMA_16G092300v4 [Glycine max]